ncbi:hypothetical protein I3F58_23430 [Streptomyces sp. MUM 203J]|uniref:hypothetical protein n=1 Tax=Streptomyces sp. MUM 203J TaxID=2791990 RepID=UPI001F03F47F|nr:hypothetical protein [Streptomyces sp. MUM 203J]MCH0542450.1 hypothetical protein [Streptomyces sp. MUM 203J]
MSLCAVFFGGTGCAVPGVTHDGETREGRPFKLIALTVVDGLPISNPGLDILVEIGAFALESYLAAQAKGEFEPEDDTVLTVTRTVNGEKEVTVYRIDTLRKLEVRMDGEFVTTVEDRRIAVEVVPGTDSTLLISDIGERVHWEGSFTLDPTGLVGDTHVDLDTGRVHEHAGAPGADFTHGGAVNPWGLEGVGEARIAEWRSALPSREECSGLPEESWRTATDIEVIFSGAVHCVRTGEGRFGRVTLGQDYEYLVWKDPDE